LVVSQSKLVLRAADRYPSNGPNRNGKVCQWILSYEKQPTSVRDDEDHNEDDADVPYFSLITGKYESSSSWKCRTNAVGQGASAKATTEKLLTAYKAEIGIQWTQ
jgi:hypothetical protein